MGRSGMQIPSNISTFSAQPGSHPIPQSSLRVERSGSERSEERSNNYEGDCFPVIRRDSE